MAIEIPEIPLLPQPVNEEGSKAIGYKWNEVAGTRHKLGGKPDGLNPNEFPTCPSCNEMMTFYGQLDSIGDNYDLADCSIIQTFVCFGCFETKSILTHTKT